MPQALFLKHNGWAVFFIHHSHGHGKHYLFTHFLSSFPIRNETHSIMKKKHKNKRTLQPETSQDWAAHELSTKSVTGTSVIRAVLMKYSCARMRPNVPPRYIYRWPRQPDAEIITGVHRYVDIQCIHRYTLCSYIYIVFIDIHCIHRYTLSSRTAFEGFFVVIIVGWGSLL